MRDLFLNINGMKLHYRVLGRGEPLLLLHGGLGEWKKDDQSPKILAEHFKVMIIDFPGFGYSQKYRGKNTLNFYASILKQFLEKLGISKVHIVGHSMGSVVALKFARTFPSCVDKLVLVSLPDVKRFKKFRWMVKPVGNYFFGSLVPKINSRIKTSFSVRNLCSHKPFDRLCPFVERCIRICPIDWIETIRDLIKTNIENLIKQVKIPYILIYGKKDPFRLKLKNTKIIEDSGHDVFFDNPRKITRIILNFLKK